MPAYIAALTAAKPAKVIVANATRSPRSAAARRRTSACTGSRIHRTATAVPTSMPMDATIGRTTVIASIVLEPPSSETTCSSTSATTSSISAAVVSSAAMRVCPMCAVDNSDSVVPSDVDDSAAPALNASSSGSP